MLAHFRALWRRKSLGAIMQNLETLVASVDIPIKQNQNGRTCQSKLATRRAKPTPSLQVVQDKSIFKAKDATLRRGKIPWPRRTQERFVPGRTNVSHKNLRQLIRVANDWWIGRHVGNELDDVTTCCPEQIYLF